MLLLSSSGSNDLKFVRVFSRTTHAYLECGQGSKLKKKSKMH